MARTDVFRPAAQRQYLVQCGDIEGLWQTKSGGNITADTTKVYDGGSTQPAVISSPAEAENITCGRAYDPWRDNDIIAKMRKGVGKIRKDILVTPLDEDGNPVGEQTIYTNALLVGVNESDADSSSGDATNWELVWAVGQFR